MALKVYARGAPAVTENLGLGEFQNPVPRHRNCTSSHGRRTRGGTSGPLAVGSINLSGQQIRRPAQRALPPTAAGAHIVKFQDEIVYDRSRPDGSPRKLVDVCAARGALGWTARIPLGDGLRSTYDWYREHADTARAVAL